MQSRTYIKNLRISPKKLRFLVHDIKKLSPVEALDRLIYHREKTGRVFYKVIKSAVSSARETLKVSDDLLRFKILLVEEGAKLKRFRPGGRGTMKPYKKRFSHIKVVLEAQPQKKEAVKKQVVNKTQKEKKPAVKKKKELKVKTKKEKTK